MNSLLLLVLFFSSSTCIEDVGNILFDHDSFMKAMEDSKTVTTNKFKMIHQESALLSDRTDIKKHVKPLSSASHEVIFAVRQQNIQEIERILLDVSDPNSVNYGKHLTKAEVRELTIIPGTAQHISNYLTLSGMKVEEVNEHTEYIKVIGTIGQWEELFDTEFYEYIQNNDESRKFIRAEHYSLPETLVEHVFAVFNTVQFPAPEDFSRAKKWKHIDVPEDVEVGSRIHSHSQVLVSGAVTPALLNNVYNITNNTAGNSLSTQALYESLDQTFSPADLTYFQRYFDLPEQNVSKVINGHSDDAACSGSGGINDCIEANLDVQYIMAVAQGAPTTYYYWNGSDFMLDWITEVAALADPPLVLSISYGSNEPGISASYISSFDVQAMKLGVMGVTVLAASGDDGAPGYQARNNPNRCGYYPSFPATSQYVTAVGGTQGPEKGITEIACQGNEGGLITTGGGFSSRTSIPSFQASQVAAYFANVSGTSKAPITGYATNGRGYPDVSLLARNYMIVGKKSLFGVYGTSASCPVFAGMVALVNAKRLSAGKSSLGWINPSLYAYSSYFVNDITEGSNNCVLNGEVCCSHGYTATTGWDPVTGLGSVNFGKFEWAFMNLVGNNPNSPTPTPSVLPGDPSLPPTRAPSCSPTVKPTASPSLSGGYLYQTTYSAYNCTGTVPKLQGAATNQCFFAYSGSTIVAFVKVICNSVYATVNIYLRSDCANSFLYKSQTIYLGCANEVNFRGSKSVSFQCSNSGTTLPLPSSSLYATQQTYTSTTGCTGSVSTFISFKENTCVSHYTGSTSYSYYLQYPNLLKYSGSTCSGSVTSTTASSTCASGHLDTSTFSNYGYTYSDDYVLEFMKAYSKWIWQTPTVTPSIVPTVSPTLQPSFKPSIFPSLTPTVNPSNDPTTSPTLIPSTSNTPSEFPSISPTELPSMLPTTRPTEIPNSNPTTTPSVAPSPDPSIVPTNLPTIDPTQSPSIVPSQIPTIVPSVYPSNESSILPSIIPSNEPTVRPSLTPSIKPSMVPTGSTVSPTSRAPTSRTTTPTVAPTTSEELTTNYQFSVDQTLEGVTYAEYSTHLDDSNTAFCRAVASCANISESDCSVTSVSESSRRRMLSMRTLSGGVTVSYVVEFSVLSSLSSTDAPQLAYNSLKTSLINSTSNGVFSAVLQTYASEQGLTELANATTSSASVSDYAAESTDDRSVDSSSKSGISTTSIILIVIGCAIGLLIFGVLYILGRYGMGRSDNRIEENYSAVVATNEEQYSGVVVKNEELAYGV